MRRVAALGLIAFALAGGALWLWMPPYPLNSVCSATYYYQDRAVIEVDGRRYSAAIHSVRAEPRPWISWLISGCERPEGAGLAFHLADDSVVLLGTGLCPAAAELIQRGQRVDLTRVCAPTPADRRSRMSAYSLNADGYLVDNATRPRFWTDFKFDAARSRVRLVSRIAEPSSEWPEDNIEEVAPNILRTAFNGGEWWRSPEAMLHSKDRDSDFRAAWRESDAVDRGAASGR